MGFGHAKRTKTVLNLVLNMKKYLLTFGTDVLCSQTKYSKYFISTEQYSTQTGYMMISCCSLEILSKEAKIYFLCIVFQILPHSSLLHFSPRDSSLLTNHRGQKV